MLKGKAHEMHSFLWVSFVWIKLERGEASIQFRLLVLKHANRNNGDLEESKHDLHIENGVLKSLIPSDKP